MPTDPSPWPEPLSVRHRPWTAPLRRPRMSNDEDRRPGLSLTNRYLTRDGQPVVPVSGELHFSRVPRHRWAERLRQLRAGGVTVVATYLFWIHHVERRGVARFDGNLDVAAFVDLCAETGLDVVLRIGPWCHGEARGGGFPDWVRQLPVRHRTDDPAYLELVREWFGQLAKTLDGRCSADGTVLGIQLENELYDQPGHLLTLKRLAREAGLAAPLWTATAWGGADLPEAEVLPVYGGYGDGFWVDADAPWHPTFRNHYFFSHVWDDPGIGADVRRLRAPGATTGARRPPSGLFPPATCELGGGMATAYHRRPWPGPLDVAAVAHCKIGSGSAWQGYYMYAGGTNPAGERGMQESHATGYPNDLPRLGYDFHAPLGEAGTLNASHAELRRQHAFLTAFGPRLAEMPSTLPDVLPSGVEDDRTLRWALRSDGRSGFLFLAWHQPHVPLPTCSGARFRVTLDDRELVLPSRPVDVPPGTLARWPVDLVVGGVRVVWATASALTLLPGEVPTLVLVADPGIAPELAVDEDGVVARAVVPSLTPVRLTTGGGVLDVLVLPSGTAGSVWVCEDGGRRLLLSDDELQWGPDGVVTVKSSGTPRLRAYDPAGRRFTDVPLAPALTPAPVTPVAAVEVTPATAVPVGYGRHGGRASAPGPGAFDRHAAVHRLRLPEWAADPAQDPLLRIDWAGDVGELRVDGRGVTDRFWDGSAWLVNLVDAGYRAGSDVTLHLLPLAADAPVHLPREARARLAAAGPQLLAIDAITVTARTTTTEA